MFPGDSEYPILLTGWVDFLTSNDGTVERFDLEIRIPSTYPDDPPLAYENCGRIPSGNDRWHRHVDGSLCLGSPIEVRRRFFGEPSLNGYIKALVLPYLASFLARSPDGIPPQGELPHGVSGILQDYYRIFSVKDPKVVVIFLSMLALRRIPGSSACPCGSGKKMKRCHAWRLNEIINIQDKRYFLRDAVSIRTFLQKA